jgi:hypothetical protein
MWKLMTSAAVLVALSGAACANDDRPIQGDL